MHRRAFKMNPRNASENLPELVNWMKILKFYKLFYRVPAFWRDYFLTSPFPDNIQTLEDLIEYGKSNKFVGFNGQCVRAYILLKLLELYSVDLFVETGTRFAHTTDYVRRAFDLNVHSCEIYICYYRAA